MNAAYSKLDSPKIDNVKMLCDARELLKNVQKCSSALTDLEISKLKYLALEFIYWPFIGTIENLDIWKAESSEDFSDFED